MVSYPYMCSSTCWLFLNRENWGLLFLAIVIFFAGISKGVWWGCCRFVFQTRD